MSHVCKDYESAALDRYGKEWREGSPSGHCRYGRPTAGQVSPTHPLDHRWQQKTKDMIQDCETNLHEISSRVDQMSKHNNGSSAYKTATACAGCQLLQEQLGEMHYKLQHATQQLERAQMDKSSNSSWRTDQDNCDSQIAELKRLLNSTKDDLAKMLARNEELKKKLSGTEETLSHMTAQLVIYKEDFESERADRERAQGQIADLKITIQQLEQKLPQQQHWSTQSHSAPPLVPDQSRHPAAAHLRHHSHSAPFNPAFTLPSNDIEVDSETPEYVQLYRPTSEQGGAKLKARGPVFQTDAYDDTDACFEPNVVLKLPHARAESSKSVTQGRLPIKVDDHGYEVIDDWVEPFDDLSTGLGMKNQPTSSGSSEECNLTGRSAVQEKTVAKVEDCLRCPKCRKSFPMEQHHLLIDHIEEVCMQ